jgi:hypothetical protein
MIFFCDTLTYNNIPHEVMSVMLDYPIKITTDLSQVTDKRYSITLY